MGGTVHYPPPPSQALEVAVNTDTARRWSTFAQFPFWQVTPMDKPEGSVKVEGMDLRFGDPAAPRFVVTVVVDASLRVVEQGFTFGALRPR
jgi:hypothetical protein